MGKNSSSKKSKGQKNSNQKSFLGSVPMLIGAVVAAVLFMAYRPTGLALPATEISHVRNRMAKRFIRTKVCLNMIAKDEVGSRLLESLHAAAFHITGYIFCDTGSTDGTPVVAKKYFDAVNLKGEVVHHQWKDFSHNRNLCLEDGRKLMAAKCDYWLLLDADQIMVTTHGLSIAEIDLSHDAYLLREVSNLSEFSNRRLVSASYPWKYLGKVHEVLDVATKDLNPLIGHLPDTIYSIHQSDMSRGFDRDALLLESALEEDPNDIRSTFYLANTYNMLDRKEEAVVLWARRTTMTDGWIEETFMATLWTANVLDLYLRGPGKTIAPSTWEALVNASLVQDKPRNPGENVTVSLDDVFSVLEKANEVLPYRKEPYYYMAKSYRIELGDMEKCAEYAEKSFHKRNYDANTLFAEVQVYRYAARDELCVCSFNAPSRARIGRQACTELIEELEREMASDPNMDAWKRNMYSQTVMNRQSHMLRYGENFENLEREIFMAEQRRNS